MKLQHGYTLLEMVVSLIVLAILGATAGHGLMGGVRSYLGVSENLQTLGKLSYASERMLREIREIRRDPSDTSRFDIATMSDQQFKFTRGTGTEVTLNASPPVLSLAYADPPGAQVLTDQVSNMRFSYYQQDGVSQAVNAAEVAFVELYLVLAQSSRQYPQRTRVALRNF